jgi:endonuclease-3
MKMLWSVANKPEEILKLPDSELHRLIHSSGFYVSKGAYIKGASKAILEIFDGNVPDKRDELMRLPGVGPKTADIILSYGFNKASIAVDTHIRRTAIRLGLAGYTYSRENVKRRLEQDIPQRDWDFADEAFLRLGKEYCKPRNPLCVDCPLAKICDFNGDDVNGD